MPCFRVVFRTERRLEIEVEATSEAVARDQAQAMCDSDGLPWDIIEKWQGKTFLSSVEDVFPCRCGGCIPKDQEEVA